MVNSPHMGSRPHDGSVAHHREVVGLWVVGDDVDGGEFGWDRCAVIVCLARSVQM